ncbi:hypothetical protein JCGZ_17676 [Jatropha curcas]|uniref:Serine/threonine-protein kinase 19 n=1 Tax=Jatropha curcas TaxID=180498 RepID=A0A067JUL4_JATCU|nr:hypothetical protein JCGZ_17676 [Jatropha curcas]
MNQISESSKGRKRLREEEEEVIGTETSDTDPTPSLEESLTFSDTLVALRIIRAQFPHIDKVSIQPFILRSQLYSCVKDRTQVDRELESLRREKLLRVFKLNTGQDDHAIMFLDDYMSQIERVVKRMKEKKQSGLEVFEWFRTHVIDVKLEPSIDHQELCGLLSHGGKLKDEQISLLINAGLLDYCENTFMLHVNEQNQVNLGVVEAEVSKSGLSDIGGRNDLLGAVVDDISKVEFVALSEGSNETRQLIDPNMYWFAVPNIGSVLKGLSQGRKELLSLLNRRRYKEMMLANLEKKRLRLSTLDIRFHLRDLIGSGHLKTVNTPTGLIVRVSKD